ncbi:hypothetical protein Rhopal_003721-T1 [Rhodotorula paludigena]|uniref:Proteophosphoglycan ppg4 n=1 Tax=Rhodotorula paludigena TaxID=86838 RepID=A0AAV5GMJ4_9BASI|nr:hypothetical protein Rhopal_003721-T1 [Rhodotorula paludigena]
MLAMQQQPSQPLEPGIRRLRKSNDKDKSKNRVSMAFKKTFSLSSSKPKSPEPAQHNPVSPHQPPAYSIAPPVSHTTRPQSVAAPVMVPSPLRQPSSGAARPQKSAPPAQSSSISGATRRPNVGINAIGSSPPLPPLPRNNSIEETADPRSTAHLGSHLASQLDPLLPRNSFGPSFEASVDGLGIGMVPGQAHSPPPPAPTGARIPSPPHTSHGAPDYRRRSHSPPQPAPHVPVPPAPQQQQQGPPPALARQVIAPEGVHIRRRQSALRADGELTESSKRLSMMKRGPPAFHSDSENGSTDTHDSNAASLSTRAPSPPAPSPVPVVEVRRLSQDPEAIVTSRDRIALLRGGRSSVSAVSGEGLKAQAGGVSALRGANRHDKTKSYTIGDTPAGFDVSLVAPQRSTFTPLKQLHLPSVHAVPSRSSPLSQSAPPSAVKPQPPPIAPAPAPLPAIKPAARRSDLYCLRPTVHVSVQTPREWQQPAASAPAPTYQARRFSAWQAATTPPQPYGAFPVPPSSIPPPVPPHDSPPQRHNISPSIYSVASFDPRSGIARGGGHRRNRSYYAGAGDVDEEDEHLDAHGREPPLPEESLRAIQQFEALDAQEAAQNQSSPVNYDIPYLSPLPYDDQTQRGFDLLATPLPPAPAPAGRSLAVSPALTTIEDRTPTPTPVQHMAPTFAAAEEPASLYAPPHEFSPRSRSLSPIPALSNGHSSDDEDLSAATSSIRRSSTPLSSVRRGSADEEPLTPPTSAVSSTFPGRQTVDGAAITDDESEEPAVVTIRKASLVTSQVRKASLVTPPSSRPQSIVATRARAGSSGSAHAQLAAAEDVASRHLSVASVGSAGDKPSKLQHGETGGFHLSLPGNGDVPPIPAVPSPIRREYGEAAFPFPASAPPKQPEIVAPSPQLATPEKFATPRCDGGAPLGDSTLTAPKELFRSASAPPEESASLPLRRQSESDTPVLRARTPGGMSREERAAKGRSFFLVQALMGESQPEGMIRDWARGDEESDDSLSIGDAESSADEDEYEDEAVRAVEAH